MSVTKRRFIATTAVTILLIAVVVLIFFGFCWDKDTYTLVLKDQQSGCVYQSFRVNNNDVFSVEFIHSVNKSPVCDYFEIKDGEIFAFKTKYSAFGAGVQTEIAEGQTLSYDKDNNMIVQGFDLKFDSVRYIVGTVSDHILEIDGQKISLRQLCGKNAHVEFVID